MRVALYSRVSTEEQALHGLSVDAQRAALETWAEGHTIVDHYCDLGVSARKPISKRPELQRLLRDVQADKIDLIAFTKLDRWTRNVREYYKAEDVLEAHGVAWRAILEDYETETASGRLKVNLMLAISQDEADRTSERIKAVFDRKREKGLAPTGSVPLGVKLVEGKYAESDDAPTVREIYTYYISTRSASATARRFKMTSNGVRYLIRNPVFKGLVVDPRTWDTANEISHQRSQRRSDRVYLFSGLIYCPHCGARLTCVRVRQYTYYRCPRHFDGACPGSHISERKVESYLLSALIPAVEDVNFRIREKQSKPVDVQALRRKQDKLTDLYLSDLINRDKYQAEFKALETAISEAEKAPRQIDVEEIKSFLETYQSLSDTAKKTFWSYLVKSITPNGKSFDFTLNYT